MIDEKLLIIFPLHLPSGQRMRLQLKLPIKVENYKMQTLFINLINEEQDIENVFPEILEVINRNNRNITWLLENVEACGNESCKKLHELSDNSIMVSDNQLRSLLNTRIQIIDGTFYSFDNSSEKPWLTINIQDGSCVDVITSDQNIILELKSIYPKSEIYQ